MDDISESPALAATSDGALNCSADRLNSPEDSAAYSYTQAHLHYGTNRTLLARVVPDSIYPNMWRIEWPDGSLSDIVNVARAKDAAIALCERGPPARNRTSMYWRLKRSRRPLEPRGAPHQGSAA
jgi:hypothetical protein